MDLEISTRKNKKFVITVNGKRIHFGDTRYEHYSNHKLPKIFKDTYPVHHDNERRERYLARATKIRDKYGNLTVDDPFSPNYYSVRLLW